ncbi:probable peroxidase 61 [Mercurialis annua]|uniref:probable peroxidase 61 n=1 Tax=Mercurialis annua TaxID=3986 RepID=UPI0021600B44|nr:probable peroxidase 61 [Mercurialis annua]
MKRSESLIIFSLLIIALSLCNVEAASSLQPPVKLKWQYYKRYTTCPEAEVYIRHQVGLFWKNDTSITPKLLRLLYSDCFVTGCDASILLDGPNSEKTAPQNRGLGGFVVIDKIKTVLEDRCPGVVSCADILNLATRDAVHLAGAPSYPVYTGRRDGMTSTAASVDLPSPSISLSDALAYFKSKNLDELDLVTLLGGHSLGQTHCSYVEDRLYNFKGTGKPDPYMDKTFATEMRKLCPRRTKKGQSDPQVFLNPDSGSNNKFTESFYKRVSSYKSVLGVDQQLLFSNDTLQIAQEFAANFEDLRRSFALSINRMGNINVLTGNTGEIRRHCRFTNKK